MGGQFLLIQNRQGKTRLAKWWEPTPETERRRLKRDVHKLVMSRDQRIHSNFASFEDKLLVYRRYAGIFCCICIKNDDNQLYFLEALHLFVEILDTFFGNVCELDIVFHFAEVYEALDEIFLAGEVSETSRKVILGRMETFESQQ